MAKFEVKNAKITKLENGNVLFERTFVEELTEKEYNEFKNNTGMMYKSFSNQVERIKAQIEAKPIIGEDFKDLTEKHLKAIEAAKMLHNIGEAEKELIGLEQKLSLQAANKKAIDLAENKKDEGN